MKLRLLCGLLVCAGCGGQGGADAGAGGGAPGAGGGGGVAPIDGGAGGGAADGGDEPGPFEWPVPTGPITVTPDDGWKNRLALPDDAFIVDPPMTEEDGLRYVKFAVLLRDPGKVYFQDTHRWPFHYEFATEKLDPLKGLSRSELDARSLHEAGQEVLFGAIVLPKDRDVRELGIQLVRLDAYHPEMVRIVFDTVVSSLDAPPSTRAFYFPTYEQEPSARRWEAWLGQRGVVVSSAARWLRGDGCYAEGWALGRLVHLSGDDIEAAYQAGTLKPTDVLLTDGVPAEAPYVAGIISLAPSTPNSHVAILAHSYGVPFGFLAGAEARARALALVGHDVVWQVSRFSGRCSASLEDLDGELSPEVRAEVLALKESPPLPVRAKQRKGAVSASVDGLGEDDVVYFGGKAVGYALLRSTIPDNAPQAVAFSFDLFDDFLDQPLASTGGTLRAEIHRRLAPYAFPFDPRALGDDLKAIRNLIKKEAVFTPAQQAAILSAVSGYEPTRKVRFRSSTNVEDTETFTGAGLYESASGCPADDLDDDDDGPSLCDATKADERGVFRALQSVYASFYGDNAVRERLRLRVPEADVGMAVLAHSSYPDDDELANGVAVLSNNTVYRELEMVSQVGALSITNPEGNATPEVMQAAIFGTSAYFQLVQRSSLVPLGATVLAEPTEYDAFAGLFRVVSDGYQALHPTLTGFALDFEYKKVRDLGLVVKQVRRLPQPGAGAQQPVYLRGTPYEFCTVQGESGDVFSNHRLKVRLRVTPRATWLSDAGLAAPLIDDAQLEYVAGAGTATLAGPPAQWAGFQHQVIGDAVVHGFEVGPDVASLRTELIRTAPPLGSPLRRIESFETTLSKKWTTPVPAVDWQGVQLRREEAVRLAGCPENRVVGPNNALRVDDITVGGVHIVTSYYFPEPPTGPQAGYTAPLYRWEETTITGLISQPLVLHGYWSQTYRPGHHNFSAEYIFDPWLEPGLSAAAAAELTQADVRWVYTDGNQLWALGLDGALRQL